MRFGSGKVLEKFLDFFHENLCEPWGYRPFWQIPQCIIKISHIAPFCNRNVHTCTHFCYKMLHCGIWHRCILGFVRWVYCNIRYPSKTHLKLKSHEILFVHNILLICQIMSEFCTEHGSITAVLCTKFWHELKIMMEVIDKWDFARFEFWMSFYGILCIATGLDFINQVGLKGREAERGGGRYWCNTSFQSGHNRNGIFLISN